MMLMKLLKMLVPLDMNNKKILNTNYDLKFGDVFKLIKCYAIFLPQQNSTSLH